MDEAAEKSMRKAKIKSGVLSIIGILLCAVFGFSLICNLVIIIKGAIQPDKPPTVFGTTPLVVMSGSMSGSAKDHIEVGDLIFIDKAEPDALKVGDVIAFKNGSITVTHRITRITADENGKLQFVTKGDANNVEDNTPVKADNVVGILKGRIPKLGNFILFVQSPLGMLLFMGIPILAFLTYDIIRRQKYANKERAKTDELEAELERLRQIADDAGTASERL